MSTLAPSSARFRPSSSWLLSWSDRSIAWLMAWSHWSSRLAMNGLPPPPEGLAVFFWRYSRYSFSSLLRSALSSSRALVISPSTSFEFC